MRWLQQNVHISWHILASGAGVIIGVAVTLAAPFLLTGWWWLIVALALVCGAAMKQARWALGVALLGGVLCGFVLGSAKYVQLAQYVSYYGQEVQLTGTIAEDLTFEPSGEQRLWLKQVNLDGRPMAGKVWASTPSQLELKRGDTVTLHGEMSEGFGNISGSLFRAQVVAAERPQPGDVARQARDWFADNVRMAVAEPQASLGLGYLVGQKTALPEALENEFQMLGLVHLVVASGSNLIIIARLLKRYLVRISKFTATASTLMFIGGFLLLTGFSTSMVRAALVAGLSLLAWHYGRTIHPVVLLVVAAAITLLFDPSFLWGDIGWYLSFAAFAGVVVFAPLLNHYFWGEKEPGFVRYIFVATLSAQLATLPIIAFTFGEYSPLALLANMLVQPLVPVAMGLTFIAGLAAVTVPAAATIVGWPAEAVLTYMTSLTSWLASSHFAQGALRIQAVTLVALYMGMLGLMIFLWRRSGYRFRSSSVVE